MRLLSDIRKAGEQPEKRKKEGRGGGWWLLSATLGLLSIFVHFGNDALRLLENSYPSKSVGTYARGNLVNGKRMPSAGANFRTYSRLGSLIGRTAVHARVRDLMLASYRRMQESHPDVMWIYGETGWPGGGSFYPHRTHQNGLSVDFMVPVVDSAGKSFPFPVSLFNGFGYALDFDTHGRNEGYSIDYAALAAHLLVLKELAGTHGLAIKRVIFAPDLRPHLFAAENGAKVKQSVPFSPRRAWVRHDDHYHVDFVLL